MTENFSDDGCGTPHRWPKPPPEDLVRITWMTVAPMSVAFAEQSPELEWLASRSTSDEMFTGSFDDAVGWAFARVSKVLALFYGRDEWAQIDQLGNPVG